VTILQLCVTDSANYHHIVEFSKSLSHIAFFEKETLASVTPCLQIVWFRAVLYETYRAVFFINHVPAHHSGNSLAMRSAINI